MTAHLNEIDICRVKELAGKARRKYGIGDDLPVADNLRLILEEEGIILCEYPLAGEDGTARSDAIIARFSGNGEDIGDIVFIGLNTANYYDLQLFAIAHELYHYITWNPKEPISGSDWDFAPDAEKKADRFAAEFLFPSQKLKSCVIDEFEKEDLLSVPSRRIIRFLASLHCKWQMPYRALVKKIFEENLINKKQYDFLYTIDERDEDGFYAKLCRAQNPNIFDRLNRPTNIISVPAHISEKLIKNYENSAVSTERFIETMELFGKNPADYGFDFSVSESDIEEINEFLRQSEAK